MWTPLFWAHEKDQEKQWKKFERKFSLQPFQTYCIVILVNAIMQEKSELTGMGNCYGKVSGDRGITRESEND